MKIKDMKIGEKGKVTAYAGKDKEYRHKLLRMGLNKGAEFKLVRKAPMGDPIEIKVNNFNLTLRKAEADILDVETLSS